MKRRIPFKKTVVSKRGIVSKAGSGVRSIVRSYSNPYRRPSLTSILKYQQVHKGGEIKALDISNPIITTTTQGNFTLNTTPLIVVLNPITVGSSAWNRIGRKVSMLSIYMTGYLAATGVALGVSSYGRVVLIYDKQTNGSLPSFDDIFRCQYNSATDSNSSAAVLPSAGINLNNRDRFEILMDKRFNLPSVEGNGISCTMDAGFVTQFINCGNREVHYKADSSPGVIGDIATGGLYIVTVGTYASGSEPFYFCPQIRLRYSDL